MADRLAVFWCDTFQRQHGFAPLFERADAVILHALRKHYRDDTALTWAIRKYMRDEEAFVQRAGWSAKVFRSRVQGYVADFYKRHPARLPKATAELVDNVVDLMTAREKRGRRADV